MIEAAYLIVTGLVGSLYLLALSAALLYWYARA